MGPSRAAVEPTVLLVGAGERFTPAFQAALARHAVQVETAELHAVVDAVIVTAPELVLLMGEAAKDGGTAVLQKLAGLSQNFTVPVVVLSDDAELDGKLSAFRHGATAVLPRSASVDATAERVAQLAREIPEQGTDSQGAVGDATLDEFIAVLSKELRAGLVSSLAASSNDGADLKLTLGRGRPLTEFLDSFVRRVRRHVVRAEPLRYELGGTPITDVPAVSRAGAPMATPEISALRVVLADDDTPRADAVAQELRRRGVTVVVTDLEPSPTRLQTLRQADPTVFVIGEEHANGAGYDLLRRLRRDARLRWASLLVVRWAEIWSEERGAPALGRLESTLAGLAEPERALLARAEARVAFDTRLETTGPARLLRTLERSQRPLRARVENPRVELTLDVSDGLVVGAEGRTLELEPKPLSGVNALAALLVLGSGRVRIEPVDQPATANVMTPVEAALTMADAETPPITPSVPAAGTVSLHPPGPTESPAAPAASIRPAPIVAVASPPVAARPAPPPSPPARPLRPEAPRPGAARPEPSRPEAAARPEPSRPGAPRPEPSRPEPSRPGAPRPEPLRPASVAASPPVFSRAITPVSGSPAVAQAAAALAAMPSLRTTNPGIAAPMHGPTLAALVASAPVHTPPAVAATTNAAPLEPPVETAGPTSGSTPSAPHERNPPAMTLSAPVAVASAVPVLPRDVGANEWRARVGAFSAWFSAQEAKLHGKRISLATTAVLVALGAFQGLLIVSAYAGVRWLTRPRGAPVAAVREAVVEPSARPALPAPPLPSAAPAAAAPSTAAAAPTPSAQGDGSGSKAPDCAELLGADPPHAGFYPGAALHEMKRGRNAIVRGDLRAAQTSLCRAASYNQESSEVAHDLALVLLLQRDGPGAEYWARRAVTLDPKNFSAQDALGDALARTGADAEARAAFIAGARLEATDEAGIHALLTRAMKQADHALRHGDFATAERGFRRAVVLEPKSSSAASGLAYALVELGDAKAGVEWARRAVELTPRNSGARLALGDALAKAGDPASAANEWREAALLDPSNREAQKRLRAAGIAVP
jgi:Flp pilus assembly protein TadD/DNA-binding response OmpR family regulator